MSGTFARTNTAGSAERRLGQAALVVAAVGTGSAAVLPGGSDGPAIRTALVITLALFFVIQLTRLLFAAGRDRSRRAALLVLLAGVTAWAAGSAMVSASQAVATVTFPAPGEVLYVISYLGMAAFLMLDVPRPRLPAAALWLDAAVVCGAAVCVSSFVVLTPLARGFDQGGVALLLAILYPLLDLLLATMVFAQMLLGHRSRSRRTACLGAGFMALAIADSSFVMTLTSDARDAYTTNIGLDVIWGGAFALIIGAACSRERSAEYSPTDRQQSRILVAAASVALVALVLHPRGTIGWCITLPAIVTLVCAGGRLVLALNEARGAAEALRLSMTDELTGLPNRRAVLAATDEGLRGDSPLGFMLLDLDGFKDINDSLGHGTGDEVLRTVAHRMQLTLPNQVLVARLGGDEFAVLTDTEDELALLELAHEVRRVLLAAVHVDNLDLAIRASIGITVRDPGDVSATDLLRRADVAMYEAKQARAGALLYDPSQEVFTRQRLRRSEELRDAIREGQLVLWYQPQVDAANRELLAMEALVRWQHPTEGLLSPIEFLPDARRAGLMPALSEWVMRQVISDAVSFAATGSSFRVAMNCAPLELLGGQLLPRLFHTLEESGLPGDRVLIEVTEESFLSDPERAREAMYQLREHEVQVAIDDYGTGFSSLSYLRALPVQELKMDRSFVSTLLTDERTRLIVATTTNMAHAMGMRLVAEGVEDEQTAQVLVEMGVDVLQGYHIAKPMPVAEIGPWVRRWAAQPTPQRAS
ncbi:putative bifunctional diguanylate cyclase/phosphodiesterase [Angustibacter sp. McL0619]|uniref:putative bifunctional diguanylate cyclase/phosphodiesterase n=1 Tax=Angustibacter sp. McL0619 TaxID=3415676 RepID=UPI003CE6BC83